jgi:hypothetical protein
MAGSKSDWLENAILDHVLGRSSTDLSTGKNATLYVALWASTIQETFTTTSTGECAGSTYARVAITNSSTTFTNASNGAKTNKIVIEMTTAAGSDWGSVKGFAICDSNTTAPGGHILYYSTITSGPKTINTGDTVQFSTGAIDITED